MQGALAIALAIFMIGAEAQSQQQQQPGVPDAPAPQQTPSGLGDLTKQVTPGKGSTPPEDKPDTRPQATPTPAAAPPPPDTFQKEAPVMDQEKIKTIKVVVNYVNVPVTVRDKKGGLVAGLRWQQFRILEDNQRQNIATFSVSAAPLSVVFVIDDTLPSDIMQKVNQSLSAVTGALTPSDSVAIVTYNTSPQLVTSFTGAQGARLPAALEAAKKPGRDMGVPTLTGPLAEGPTINGQSVDPNLNPQRGNQGGYLFLPKEVHPLNDAILFAAEQLRKEPRDRRRVIYVISDGKNVRSKATYKEVVHYLLTNEISVNGTMVGDASVWGIGYLDRLKLPLLQPENVLPRYTFATGGSVDSEFSENGMQNSFAKITGALRTQYTLGYISHQPTISGKYHNIDVRVEGTPGLTVDAKAGYYPAATNEQ
jgi:VWFA-related protein